MITLFGKTALITGAAGGIGQVLCALFAELGATVIAVDRDQQRLSDFVAASAAKGVRLQPLCADITDEKAFGAGLEEAVGTAGDPTILVNNAGFARADSLEDCDLATWRHEVDGNLTGPYVVTMAVRPGMKRAPRFWWGGGASALSLGLSPFAAIYGSVAARRLAQPRDETLVHAGRIPGQQRCTDFDNHPFRACHRRAIRRVSALQVH